MGMTVSVYRWGLGECTNGGISARVGSLCVTNVEGPFNPGPALPAVELVQGPGGKGHAILQDPRQRPGMVGPMFGGNYAETSDSRFQEALRKVTGARFYGAVPIHDRWETPAEYEALSR